MCFEFQIYLPNLRIPILVYLQSQHDLSCWPRYTVVRITDRPSMTLAVDDGLNSVVRRIHRLVMILIVELEQFV